MFQTPVSGEWKIGAYGKRLLADPLEGGSANGDQAHHKRYAKYIIREVVTKIPEHKFHSFGNTLISKKILIRGVGGIQWGTPTFTTACPLSSVQVQLCTSRLVHRLELGLV